MAYRIVGGATKGVSIGDFDTWMDVQIAAATGGASGYNAVSWIYRCHWLRCNGISDMPYVFVRTGGEDEIDEPFPMKRLFWMCEAALLTSGAFYVLKNANRVAVKGLQWLNPQTMTVKTNADGIESFVQKIGAAEKVFRPEQIVYGRYWNPNDDLGPGVCPLEVLKTEADLAQYLNQWGAKFFEQGAIPAILLHTDTTLPKGEAERIESRWKQMVSGIKNAWKAIVLQSGLKPEVLTPPVKDLVVPELSALIRQQIATAYGVPQTLLEDAANYATAVEHNRAFVTRTLAPEAELIAEAFNGQLFEGMNLELQFRPNELDEMQADEAARAVSLGQLVTAGVPLKMGMEILGYDLTAEQWAALEQAEEEKKQRAEEMAERMAQPGEPERPFGRNGNGREPDEDEEREAVRGELRLWRRKALKRLRDGRPALCTFSSERIPGDVKQAVEAGLNQAKSAQDINVVFEMLEGGEPQSIDPFAGIRERMHEPQLREVERTIAERMMDYFTGMARRVAESVVTNGA